MAPYVVAKTAAIVAKLRYLAAIELLAAAQAIDLRELPHAELGKGTQDAYAAVRARVARLDEDRPLGPDIETVAALLAADGIATTDLLPR